MFEHLGHIPETTHGRKHTNWKKYIGFLLATVGVFVFVSNFVSGPETSASQLVGGNYINIDIFANSQSKNIVADTPRVILFNFVIETDREGIYLNKLNLNVDGIYDPSILTKVKLMYGDVQVGGISKIDEASIYFDLDTLALGKGENIFNLVLNNDSYLSAGDNILVNLEKSGDMVLAYNGHTFSPDGNFPVYGGAVSFTLGAQVEAYNNFQIKKFLVVEDVPQPLASFALLGSGEMSDLKTLTISYEGDEDLSGSQFVLLHEKDIVARGKFVGKDIVFDIDGSLVLKLDKKLDLYLHSLGLPKGEYKFYLSEVEATGYASKETLLLTDSLMISQVEALDYYPELSLVKIDENLSLGWNQVYDLEIKALGDKNIKLNKLSWLLKTEGVQLSQAELVVDHKAYPVDIILSEDKVVAKFDWSEPLPISTTGTEIGLFVRVDSLKPNASILSYLLDDKIPLTDDALDGNIIWSVEDELYNSYLLPYLPLEPILLVN